MANILQQIGCRYVTKFYTNTTDGTPRWEDGVAYEALVCVSYKYGAYVSKIPVPADAGNPADNPTYWAEFPNPSMGAWEELRVRLSNEIEDRENADAELLDKLNAEIARAKEAETQLGDDLTTETNARISADNAVNQKLEQEITDRQDGDETLQATITKVANDLASEVTRATDAETSLSGRLSYLVTYTTNALSDIINKIYGGGTVSTTDGHITWGESGTVPLGNMNVYGNSDASKYIRTHAGNSEDDVRVN